jgi:hypothetical protein
VQNCPRLQTSRRLCSIITYFIQVRYWGLSARYNRVELHVPGTVVQYHFKNGLTQAQQGGCAAHVCGSKCTHARRNVQVGSFSSLNKHSKALGERSSHFKILILQYTWRAPAARLVVGAGTPVAGYLWRWEQMGEGFSVCQRNLKVLVQGKTAIFKSTYR